jgi:hypothetical protein
MRTTTIMVLFLAVLSQRPASAHTGAGGDLGLGVGVGQPTGLTLETSLTPRQTVEFAIGLDPLVQIDRGYAHGVYKWAFADIARGQTANVPIYVGAGGFIADYGMEGDVLDAGVRVPFGVNVDFKTSPVQLFGEVAADLAVIQVNHEHEVVGLGGYAGMRYWF